MYTFHHSPKNWCGPVYCCSPRRPEVTRSTHPLAALGAAPSPRFALRPRTAANGRGGRIRTGTGNDAQRVLSPPCLRSNHAAINWCGQRESHPHELALTGFSLRRVYCFATSAKTGASTGTCALLSALPRQSVAFYGLDAKWSKRKDSHLREPARATRLQRAAIAALPRFENGGSSGIRTRDLLLMRELRCLLRHRANWWAASVMLRVLPVKSRRLHD